MKYLKEVKFVEAVGNPIMSIASPLPEGVLEGLLAAIDLFASEDYANTTITVSSKDYDRTNERVYFPIKIFGENGFYGENSKLVYRVKCRLDKEVTERYFEEGLDVLRGVFNHINIYKKKTAFIGGRYINKKLIEFEIHAKRNVDISQLLKGPHPSFRSILNLNLKFGDIEPQDYLIMNYTFKNDAKEKKVNREKEKIKSSFLDYLTEKAKQKDFTDIYRLYRSLNKEEFIEKNKKLFKNFF